MPQHGSQEFVASSERWEVELLDETQERVRRALKICWGKGRIQKRLQGL